jgi:hypothetical protein
MDAAGNLHGLSASFFVLFAHHDWQGCVCGLVVVLGAFLGSRYVGARRIATWAGDRPFIIAAMTVLSCALGNLFVYHNHPLAMDEYAAYFQSRVFAAGHLQGGFPAQMLDWLIPPGFQDYFLNVSRSTGGVAEAYWPGFALLLTPFMWAGVPWLCNPVVSGLTLIVIHQIALNMFEDREAAGFVLLLTIAAPVIFANGISYYSMPAHLLANSVFALLLSQPNPIRAAAAGAVGSLALVLHNPVPHLLFAVPWLIWVGARPRGFRLLAALVAGYLPLVALLGWGWFIFSGLLVQGGLDSGVALDLLDRLSRALQIFSLPDGKVFLARLIGIAKVWVWAVPGLVILAIAGAMRWRHHTQCRLFTASAMITLVGYLLVPVDQGHGWGYRYFHSSWMSLPLLATAALFRPAFSHSENSSLPSLFEDRETRRFVAACVLLALVLSVGLRAWQIQRFVARDLIQVPQYQGAGKRVTIIEGRFSFYGADLVQNDPWLRGGEVRMYSHGDAEDTKMMAQYYPDYHQVYADRYGTVWSQ